MKAFSQFCMIVLAFGLAIPVVGRSDIFCLTRDDCKERQNELGLKKFKSGRYSNMGRGCFSKFDTLYWSTGGSYKQKTTYDLGWSAKVRVTCEQISTVAPSNAPTTAPTNVPTTTAPTNVPTTTAPTNVPTTTPVVTDTPTRQPVKSTIPTSAPTLTSNNYTVYQTSTLQDYNDVELTESVFASDESVPEVESAVQVEVAEAYLTNSKPAEASHRFLEIGVAGFSVGLLFVAALIHRSRQRSESQNRNNEPIAEVSVENSRSESFDTENLSTNPFAQNMMEIAEAASENTDGMSCWIPTDYNQQSLDASTSFGDGTSELMWSSVGTSISASVGTSISASVGTESTYTEEGSVKTTKISNIT